MEMCCDSVHIWNRLRAVNKHFLTCAASPICKRHIGTLNINSEQKLIQFRSSGKTLNGITSIRYYHSGYARFTDDDLKFICTVFGTYLENFTLLLPHGDKVTTRGFTVLANLRRLKLLRVSVPDGVEFVQAIEDLSELTSLTISSRVEYLDSHRLVNIPNLTELTINSPSVTDDFVHNVSLAVGIEFLSLKYCDRITRKGIDYISELNCMTCLLLGGLEDIGDDFLSSLSSMNSLERLLLPNLYRADYDHVTRLEDHCERLNIQLEVYETDEMY
jgi:hypothetical protein